MLRRLVFLISACLLASTAQATTYTGFCHGVTDSSLIETIPKINRPTYLVSFKDSIFKTLVTRIAGDSNSAIPGLASSKWSGIARHHYSKDQPWNVDQSRIFIDNPAPGTPTKL